MKILLIGMGMTHYDNQVFNKLHEEPHIEVFNLIKSGGFGGMEKGSKAVFQTKKGVKYNIVELDEIIKERFSDYSYISYINLDSWLKENKPDIIVVSELYSHMFLRDQEVIKTVKELGIKIIRKDIPFRLDSYEESKRKILAGELDNEYVPFFDQFFTSLCNRLRLKFIPSFVSNLLHTIGISSVYKKNIGRKVLLKRLEAKKQFMNLADAHVNYTEKAFELFKTYGVPKEKIFIIYNSPDTDILFDIRKKIEKEDSILPPSKHRLIHVGRLVEWKRVDMLIESVNTLKPEFPDIELLIIGYGPLEDTLKSLTKKLHLEDSVKFIGGVYEPEILGKYLLSSTIYILAGMGGISINDAMIFGKPVICSVCDGTEKKLVKEGVNGMYFTDGSVLSLTEKIKYMLKNQELTKKMGENSTNIIKNEINIHTVINGYKKAFDFVLRTS